MARRLLVQDLCDDCDFDEISDVAAVTEHTLTVDGDRPRRVQLCPKCAIYWGRLITIYKEKGQDIEPPPAEAPDKKAPKGRKPKAVKAAKPKQLEKPPDENSAPPKPRQVIWCPLEHPTEGGAGKAISYADRNSHADQVHDHARLWEIPWGDPENILHFPCDAHAECMKIGLSFATSRGLAQHRGACPLPRIDQEGDPQKADEPAP